MNACDLVRRLHQHRMWANQKLLKAAQSLSIDQLHEPFSIGQCSVWKTLTHLLAAEYVWLEALLGHEESLMPGDAPGKLPGNQEGERTMSSFAELSSKWKTIELRWNEYLLQLSDEALDEIVYRISTSSRQGKRHGSRRADVLLHVCTHAQYTTAQLVNMLRQLGSTQLPDVMLISLARQESAANDNG